MVFSWGDAKLYQNEDISIRWYTNAQTITVSGNRKDEIEEKLNSLASISKKLANTEDHTEFAEQSESHIEEVKIILA